MCSGEGGKGERREVGKVVKDNVAEFESYNKCHNGTALKEVGCNAYEQMVRTDILCCYSNCTKFEYTRPQRIQASYTVG